MKSLGYIFLFVLLAGCYKPVTQVDPDFIGTWRADDQTFFIQAGSKSLYEDRSDIRRKSQSGWAKIKDNKLKIGTKRWDIDQFPTPVQTTDIFGSTRTRYVAIIDGTEFLRDQ